MKEKAAVVVFWFALAVVVAGLLSGCSGYPRFNPTSCSTVEIDGRPTGLWTCEGRLAQDV